MTACEIAVQSSVDELPNASVLSDALGRLRYEASSLHADVADAVAELRRTLLEARATGNMLQNASLLSNPALKVVGGSIVFTVDRVLPKVDDLSNMIASVFEGFDVAAGGAGNPDRVAAIAAHLRVEVGAKLVEFADAVSYSRLATPGRWDSPAADSYHSRADTQSTDGLRPLAASIEDAAHALEEYAGAQAQYADEVSKLWVKLFWFMLSLLGIVLGGIKTATGLVASSGGAVVFKAGELAGWVATFISLVSAYAAFNSLQRDLDRVDHLPHPACELLQEQLAAASEGVDMTWPRFTTDS